MGAVVAGTHVIGKAKEYVDGCGGPTDILVLRSDGTIEGISWLYTEPLERLLRAFDSNFGPLLMGLLTKAPSDFIGSVEYFGRIMAGLRKELAFEEDEEYKYRAQTLQTTLMDWGIREEQQGRRLTIGDQPPQRP